MPLLSNSSFTKTWLFKYKLYHIPFWCLYHYAWWALATNNALETILFTPFSVKYLFYVVFQAIAVYFNLYFLIPRFLERGKYIQYTTYLLLNIFIISSILVTAYYVVAWIAGRPFFEIFNVDPGNYKHFFFNNALPSTVASTTLAMSIKLTKNWIESTRRQQLLEKEKLETELKFLRSQFNPHFLFNTINSIFFLIHKNPVQASSSLAKFSDLLRYQLYECNEMLIPLRNEVAYLESFIELEKLRHSKSLQLFIDIEPQTTSLVLIAPFVLITFTENAFKHISSHDDQPNWIKLKLKVENTTLYFSIVNSVSAIQANEVISYGGIGLRNVKRRLDLIYPGQYQLNIKNDQNVFSVELTLNLAEAETEVINKSA